MSLAIWKGASSKFSLTASARSPSLPLHFRKLPCTVPPCGICGRLSALHFPYCTCIWPRSQNLLSMRFFGRHLPLNSSDVSSSQPKGIRLNTLRATPLSLDLPIQSEEQPLNHSLTKKESEPLVTIQASVTITYIAPSYMLWKSYTKLWPELTIGLDKWELCTRGMCCDCARSALPLWSLVQEGSVWYLLVSTEVLFFL